MRALTRSQGSDVLIDILLHHHHATLQGMNLLQSSEQRIARYKVEDYLWITVRALTLGASN